jgi:hypothetical protein
VNVLSVSCKILQSLDFLGIQVDEVVLLKRRLDPKSVEGLPGTNSPDAFDL